LEPLSNHPHAPPVQRSALIGGVCLVRFPRCDDGFVVQLFPPVVGVWARRVLGLTARHCIMNRVLQGFGQVENSPLQIARQATKPLGVVGLAVHCFPPHTIRIHARGDRDADRCVSIPFTPT
jgi:hypothetical protein